MKPIYHAPEKNTSTGSFPKSCSYTQPRAAIRSVVQCVFSRRRILSKTTVTVTHMKTGQQVSEAKMPNPDEPWRDVTSPDDSPPSPRQPHPRPHATFAPMHIANRIKSGRYDFHGVPDRGQQFSQNPNATFGVSFWDAVEVVPTIPILYRFWVSNSFQVTLGNQK